ncbi:MAG: DHH family phosphoesterase [bacterium]|nr:DHH family phosphoesterase [bacterium]
MELSPKQQIVEIIKKSEDILLISHSKPGGDSVGSLLALKRVLQEIGKKVSVVVSDPIPNSLTFLPDISDIKKTVDGSNDLVLKVNIENIDIEKISTNADGKTLDIILTPQNGKLDADSVKVESGKPSYDAIIVLDTPDVDKIDKIYDEFTELFFETPVVNIDHHAGNEYFGTINLVDLTATSTAEILVAIFEALGKSKPDEDTATLLLAGITADTASFKNTNTTPKTLTVAAQLLAAGAHQQEIIQNFYKMKTLKTLKLWGKILSNVQKDTEYRIVWSKVNNDDFVLSGVTIEGAKEVMDEMLANTPNADVVALLVETDKGMVTVLLKGIKGTDVLKIAEVFGGSGQALAATFEMKNIQLSAAEAKVLDEIKKIRAKKLGRPITEETGTVQTDVQVEKAKEVEPEKVVEELKVEAPVQKEEKVEDVTEETKEEEKKSEDSISKAIESLEASGETIEAEEIPKEKIIQKDPNSMTHVSEILKKFNPTDQQKLNELRKKNEEARQKLKQEKEHGGK